MVDLLPTSPIVIVIEVSNLDTMATNHHQPRQQAIGTHEQTSAVPIEVFPSATLHGLLANSLRTPSFASPTSDLRNLLPQKARVVSRCRAHQRCWPTSLQCTRNLYPHATTRTQQSAYGKCRQPTTISLI